jgi:uncharacterized membrane-anchored protein YhcB (DUF1043 family)|tara:strand:- start:314 stop:826 length:513 start_codon:yes stop_codon:yes gene_type:complete
MYNSFKIKIYIKENSVFSLSTLIITALACTGLGAVISLLVMRNSSHQQNNRQLQDSLQQAEGNLQGYQQEVSDHFTKTAELINNLTQDYKDVHEHLANSALKLSNAELSRSFIESANSQLPTSEQVTMHDENLEAPRDWAPKSPGKKGALSEDYGMEEERKDIAASTVAP